MKYKTILNWGMIASVFMDDFILFRYQIPFDFYVYYIVFFLNIGLYVNTHRNWRLIPKWFMWSIVALGVSTLITCTLEQSFTLGVLKQFVGVLFTSIAYYSFLANNNFEIKRIFRMYVFVAFFVALEGLLEEVLNLSGIHINEKIRLTTAGFYRIFGIMGEPYFLAVALLPALFFVFYKSTIFERVNSKIGNIVLLLVLATCFIFTFSSAGAIGIVGIAFFWLVDKKYMSFRSWKIVLLPVLVIGLVTAFGNIQKQWKEFNIKLTHTLYAFSTNSTQKKDIELLNTSSFALYSNFIIAKASFEDYPLTGTGLGTHENNYRKHFKRYFDDDFVVRYGVFNTADANSLFVRLMSETGLLGLGLFFGFMFRNLLYLKGYDDPELRDYTLINQGIFILFIIRLIRTGNYFGNGFFLFFFMYYISRKIVEKKLKEKALRLA